MEAGPKLKLAFQYLISSDFQLASIMQFHEKNIVSIVQKLNYVYTRRQINLYRMFFADFSVNSQPIFIKFCMDYVQITRRLP